MTKQTNIVVNILMVLSLEAPKALVNKAGLYQVVLGATTMSGMFAKVVFSKVVKAV